MPNCGLTFGSFFPNRTDGLDAVKKLNERNSAWWDNFLSETFTEEYWRWNFCESRRSLCQLVDELRVNPDTCGRANSIWIRIRVDVEIFESAKKNLWTQNYPDTSGRGLKVPSHCHFNKVWQRFSCDNGKEISAESALYVQVFFVYQSNLLNAFFYF